jgi:hypothetical protein
MRDERRRLTTKLFNRFFQSGKSLFDELILCHDCVSRPKSVAQKLEGIDTAYSTAHPQPEGTSAFRAS